MFRSLSEKKKKTDPKYLRERLNTVRQQVMYAQQRNAEAIVDQKPLSQALAVSRQFDAELEKLESKEAQLRKDIINMRKDRHVMVGNIRNTNAHEGTLKRLEEKDKEVAKQFSELSDEFLHLVKMMKLQEEILNSLTLQLRSENIVPQALPVPSYEPKHTVLPMTTRESLYADPKEAIVTETALEQLGKSARSKTGATSATNDFALGRVKTAPNARVAAC